MSNLYVNSNLTPAEIYSQFEEAIPLALRPLVEAWADAASRDVEAQEARIKEMQDEIESLRARLDVFDDVWTVLTDAYRERGAASPNEALEPDDQSVVDALVELIERGKLPANKKTRKSK